MCGPTPAVIDGTVTLARLLVKVPPLSVTVPPPTAPLVVPITKVPASTYVPAEYVLDPVRVSVPGPSLTSVVSAYRRGRHQSWITLLIVKSLMVWMKPSLIAPRRCWCYVEIRGCRR